MRFNLTLTYVLLFSVPFFASAGIDRIDGVSEGGPPEDEPNIQSLCEVLLAPKDLSGRILANFKKSVFGKKLTLIGMNPNVTSAALSLMELSQMQPYMSSLVLEKSGDGHLILNLTHGTSKRILAGPSLERFTFWAVSPLDINELQKIANQLSQGVVNDSRFQEFVAQNMTSHDFESGTIIREHVDESRYVLTYGLSRLGKVRQVVLSLDVPCQSISTYTNPPPSVQFGIVPWEAERKWQKTDVLSDSGLYCRIRVGEFM